jgi:hypothetical protein
MSEPIKPEERLNESRRDFLRDAVVVGGGAVSALGVTVAQAQGSGEASGKANHYYVPATDKTVHWGYFSRSLKPLVQVNSGDFVTLETLTHHARDDMERQECRHDTLQQRSAGESDESRRSDALDRG